MVEGDKKYEKQYGWKKDKTSPKYLEYLKRYKKSMKKKAREKLDKLNKTPPLEKINES